MQSWFCLKIRYLFEPPSVSSDAPKRKRFREFTLKNTEKKTNSPIRAIATSESSNITVKRDILTKTEQNLFITKEYFLQMNSRDNTSPDYHKFRDCLIWHILMFMDSRIYIRLYAYQAGRFRITSYQNLRFWTYCS